MPSLGSESWQRAQPADWSVAAKLLIAIVYCLAFMPATGCSEEDDSEAAVLQSLIERIEAVERDNQQLRQDLLETKLPPSPPDPDSDDAVNRLFLNDSDDPRLRSLVQELYQEFDAQRQLDAADNHWEIDESPADDLMFRARWNHGLTFATGDRAFQVHVGGRTQFDTAWFDVPQNIQNDPTTINKWGDGVDFRRVRFKVDGTMYDFIEWAAQFDIVNSTRDAANDKAVPAPTDLWWTFTKLPMVGNVRVGNQKEPIGFEHLVSSRFLPFMERSFNQDSFYGGFNNGFTPGVSMFHTAFDERLTWAWGVFKPTRNVFAFSTSSSDWATTGRLTFLPYYELDGERLIHVGASARLASTFDHQIQFRTRGPERSGISSVWPRPADTGIFFGDSMQWLNAELVGVRGPWTFQAEYLVSGVQGNIATVAQIPVSTVCYHGGYAQVLYFLTGEHDHYSRQTSVFERVIPAQNVERGGGYAPGRWHCGGAWQIGLRYNYLDLSDEGINGGVLHDVTAGLNWFLNPNMKLQWNYSATHRETASGAGDGFIHGFGIRLAHDF